MSFVLILLFQTSSLAVDDCQNKVYSTSSQSEYVNDFYYFANERKGIGCVNRALCKFRSWNGTKICADQCFLDDRCHVFARRDDKCELYLSCTGDSTNIHTDEIWLLKRSSTWGDNPVSDLLPRDRIPTSTPSQFPTSAPTQKPTSPSKSPTSSPTRGIDTCINTPKWRNKHDETCDDLVARRVMCESLDFGEYGISQADACCNCYGGGYFLLNSNDPGFPDVATDIDLFGNWSMSMYIKMPAYHPHENVFHYHLLMLKHIHIWIQGGFLCMHMGGEIIFVDNNNMTAGELYTIHIEHGLNNQNGSSVRFWANDKPRNISKRFLTTWEDVYDMIDLHELHHGNNYDREPSYFESVAVLKDGIYFASHVSHGHEVPSFHEVYMPPRDESTINLLHLFIGPGIVLLTYALVIVGTTLISKSCKTDRPFYFKILTIFLGFYDFAANLQLVILLLWRDSYWGKLGLVFTIIPFFMSQVYLVLWYRQESRKDTVLGRHLVTKQRFVLPVMLLASAQMNILALAWSRILPITLFHMPISSEQRNEVMQGRAINIICQDAPMVILQLMVLLNADGDDSSERYAAWIAFGGTVCALVVSLHYVCSTSFQRFENSTFKSQWITLENPVLNPLMLQSSIKKRFQEYHKSEIVEVQVIRTSCESYRIVFKFTGQNELNIKSEIRQSLKICTNDDSRIIYEDPPIIQEILQQATAMCSTFLTNQGRIHVDPVGHTVTVALKNVDTKRVLAVVCLDDVELEHAISVMTKFHDKLTRNSQIIRSNVEENCCSNSEIPDVNDPPSRIRTVSDELTMTDTLRQSRRLPENQILDLGNVGSNSDSYPYQMSPRSMMCVTQSICKSKSHSKYMLRDHTASKLFDSNSIMSPAMFDRKSTRRSTSNIADVVAFDTSRRNLLASPSSHSFRSVTEEESGGVILELSDSKFGSNREAPAFTFPEPSEEEDNSDSSSQHSQAGIFTPSSTFQR